jgi:hypothetical protein
MRLCQASAAVLLVALTPQAATANDSTGWLAAGGLVLTKSADIEMQTEDLYISEGQVRVKYGFLNTSPKDITVTVAFPLPDITLDDTLPYDDIPNIPDEASANFLGFVTTVAGKPVKMQVEQKASVGGADYAATLRKYKVPLAPELPATAKALNGLPRVAQDGLINLGVVTAQNADEVSATAKLDLIPAWTLKTTFYWSQTFPAGRVLQVAHRYTPSVGNFVTTQLAPDPATLNDDEAQSRQREIQTYCVDDGLIQAVKAAATSSGGASQFFEEYLDYVLTTGANWKGPIGDFTMTIDKGAASSLVSFCGDGVRKIGPTTFQVHYTNFTPTKDVSVLILRHR